MVEMKPKFGELGFITFARTYARTKDDGKLESFEDARERVLTACNTQLGVGFTTDEIQEFREILTSFKGSVAGRFWWQLGTSTVDKLGLFSLSNCAAVVINEPIRPFTWAFDALMLGSGVGFNIQREYVYELPPVKHATITRSDTYDADFIVPDSREGWVELLKRTLEAHFITGKGFSYSAICIRGAGLPIKGFGGVSSGPESLCAGIGQISDKLNERGGKKARPIDCLDIMCIIGAIVVSGNVRRSSLIAIGDFDDLQYLSAKRWDLGTIPNYRAMVNCSVVCNDFSKLPEQFWDGYRGNGEPFGLVNLKMAREVGRAGDTRYPDKNVMISNPCVTGDTELLTPDGYRRIDSLVGELTTIWNGFEWSEVTPEITGENQPVIDLVFDHKRSLSCTPYHKFYIVGFDAPVMAKDLEIGDIIIPHYIPIGADNVTASGITVTAVHKDDREVEYVYCFNEPKRHMALFNGILTGQCSEQFLENHEVCSLGEVFLPNAESPEDLFTTVKYIYRSIKHSLALPCHAKETEEVVHRNMRMGIGVTGYMQSTPEQRSWLAGVYERLREFDVRYSASHKFPNSIKLLTIKPSGTLSLLPGVTPGVHPAYSRHYIRRIRLAANSPLVETCRSHGYPVEFVRNFDGTPDARTVVASFPIKVPDHATIASQVTAIDQLEAVRTLQADWSDNAVSCTIYYKAEELEGIKQYLTQNYNHSFKALSFLLHSEHGFQQAPYEEITEEQYLELKSKVIPIVDDKVLSSSTPDLDSDCEAGGYCPVR